MKIKYRAQSLPGHRYASHLAINTTPTSSFPRPIRTASAKGHADKHANPQTQRKKNPPKTDTKIRPPRTLCATPTAPAGANGHLPPGPRQPGNTCTRQERKIAHLSPPQPHATDTCTPSILDRSPFSPHVQKHDRATLSASHRGAKGQKTSQGCHPSRPERDSGARRRCKATQSQATDGATLWHAFPTCRRHSHRDRPPDRLTALDHCQRRRHP